MWKNVKIVLKIDLLRFSPLLRSPFLLKAIFKTRGKKGPPRVFPHPPGNVWSSEDNLNHTWKCPHAVAPNSPPYPLLFNLDSLSFHCLRCPVYGNTDYVINMHKYARCTHFTQLRFFFQSACKSNIVPAKLWKNLRTLDTYNLKLYYCKCRYKYKCLHL